MPVLLIGMCVLALDVMAGHCCNGPASPGAAARSAAGYPPLTLEYRCPLRCDLGAVPSQMSRAPGSLLDRAREAKMTIFLTISGSLLPGVTEI